MCVRVYQSDRCRSGMCSYVQVDEVRCATSAGQTRGGQCAGKSSAASTVHSGCVALSLTSLLQRLFVLWFHQGACGRGPQSLHSICAVFSSEHEGEERRRGEERGGEGRGLEERIHKSSPTSID